MYWRMWCNELEKRTNPVGSVSAAAPLPTTTGVTPQYAASFKIVAAGEALWLPNDY
jgi:hypothetical protein